MPLGMIPQEEEEAHAFDPSAPESPKHPHLQPIILFICLNAEVSPPQNPGTETCAFFSVISRVAQLSDLGLSRHSACSDIAGWISEDGKTCAPSRDGGDARTQNQRSLGFGV